MIEKNYKLNQNINARPVFIHSTSVLWDFIILINAFLKHIDSDSWLKSVTSGNIYKLLRENEIADISFYCGPIITWNKLLNPL